MSHPHRRAAWGDRRQAWVFWGAAASAAVVLCTVGWVESAHVEHDLLVSFPSNVRVDEPIPVRAVLLTGLQDAEAPRLLPAQVSVSVTNANGRAISHRALTRHGVALDGSLPPIAAPGTYALTASATSGGAVLATLHARLVVSARGASQTLGGRHALALQHGAIVAAPLGDSLAMHVQGGACRPEIRCIVTLVAPERSSLETGSLALEPSASVSVTGYAAPSPRVFTATVVTHGPEAEATLVWNRPSAEPWRYTLRLPVELSAPALEVEPAFAPASGAPRVTVRGAERGKPALLDAFLDGRWLRAGTIDHPSRGASALPFAPLTPGEWTLQVTTDPLGASSVGVRRVRVLPSGAKGPCASSDRGCVALAAASLAAEEGDAYALPASLHSQPGEDARLLARRERTRALAVVALLLLGVIVASLLVSRGFAASRQAGDVMALAEQDEASRARDLLRARLTIVAISAAVALAFVAVAVLAWARIDR